MKAAAVQTVDEIDSNLENADAAESKRREMAAFLGCVAEPFDGLWSQQHYATQRLPQPFGPAAVAASVEGGLDVSHHAEEGPEGAVEEQEEQEEQADEEELREGADVPGNADNGQDAVAAGSEA
eukprot:6050236-Karenia_brevis.AAC.1